MKLETSEAERAELMEWCVTKTEEWKTGFAPHLAEQTVWAKSARLLRDIDTLLAEVERLREDKLFKAQVDKIASLYARIDELTAERAQPAESVDDTAYEIAEVAWKDFGGKDEDRPARARLEAAIRKALAVWRPIETAPKDGTVFDVWLGDAEPDEQKESAG